MTVIKSCHLITLPYFSDSIVMHEAETCLQISRESIFEMITLTSSKSTQLLSYRCIFYFRSRIQRSTRRRKRYILLYESDCLINFVSVGSLKRFQSSKNAMPTLLIK